MAKGIAGVACVLAAGLMASPAAAKDVQGDWIPEDKSGRMRIAPCASDASRLCGTIVYVAVPNDSSGKPRRDVNNTDPAQRNRTIMGLMLISGFKPAGPGKWAEGKIYNPEDGKTYKSKLELRPDGKLKVSGCVLVICKSQVWTRPTSG